MDQRERAVVKALVQVIWADGEVSEPERALLDGLLVELGASEAEIEEVARMMENPPDMGSLCEQIPEMDAREEIMKLLLAMSMVDGRLDTSEIRFLNRLAEHLEIPDATLEALKEQTLLVMQEEA